MQNVTDAWLPSCYYSEIALQFESCGDEKLCVWHATRLQAAIKAVIESLPSSISGLCEFLPDMDLYRKMNWIS